MGIGVYGIIDKYSRLEIGLWAAPDVRHIDVPPALYLCAVREQGGMFPRCLLKLFLTHFDVGIPVSTTSDKGGELGKFIALQIGLR